MHVPTRRCWAVTLGLYRTARERTCMKCWGDRELIACTILGSSSVCSRLGEFLLDNGMSLVKPKALPHLKQNEGMTELSTTRNEFNFNKPGYDYDEHDEIGKWISIWISWSGSHFLSSQIFYRISGSRVLLLDLECFRKDDGRITGTAIQLFRRV